MTASTTNIRNTSKSHESNAPARRRGTRTARASVAAAAANGLEALESRVLMSAVRPDAAFSALDLGVGDDRSFPTTGSTGYSLGFSTPINFFGSVYSGVFINNNGHVSLGARNSFYTNVDLDSLNARVIAPFYANVDTRFAGSTVKYGRGTVDGRAAFAVNWVNVDYYYSSASHTNRNSFQLVMIDRSDLGAGNFDMEFNYGKVLWEGSTATGADANGLGGSTARIGWQGNSGSLNGIYQMAGSNVAGSFLDGNLITGLVHNSFMSDVDGRYVFRFRGGTWADAPTSGPENTAPTVDLPDTTLVVEDQYGTGRLNLAGVFGDPDADNWLASVDYGDGRGTQILELDGAKGFNLLNAYFTPGAYNVTVTVDDGKGGVATDTMTVLVEDHSAPVVNVSGPLTVRENESGLVTFDLNDDVDVNDTYSFHWSGSGMEGDWGQFLFHADDSGTHTVTLTVTDQSGNSTTLEVPVTVENVAPTASGFVGMTEVDEGGTLTLGLDGADDASPADLAAGLLYSFDFDGDGVFEVCSTAAAASFVYADSGSYLVRARVSDKDGGYSDYTMAVNVRNVAPHGGSLVDDNPVAEGSAVTVSFTGQQDPSSADMAAGFTYSFDFDGDGVFELSGTSPSATHAFDDNGVHVVRGRVTDKDGGYTDYATEVEVYNVAPTASVSSGTGVEGSAVTVAFGAASDASGADFAAGFTYSFDFDNDGVFDVTGASASASHVFANDGVHTVRARVTDKDGGFTDYTASVSVSNAPPVITATSNSASTLGSAYAGSTVTVGAVFGDAGVLDRHTLAIDWGDGSSSIVPAASSGGAGSASGSHVYAQGGIYTVTLTVADDASPAGFATVTTQVFVTGVGLHNGILQIVGTDRGDRVRVSADNHGNIRVQSDFADDVVFSGSSVREIHATLGAGRDNFSVARDVTKPVYLNGAVYGSSSAETTTLRTKNNLFSERRVA